MIETNAFHSMDGFTWVDVLQRQAGLHGDDVAYTMLSGQNSVEDLTYSDLEERVRSLASELQRLADPGDRALLFLPAGLEFVIAFLACSYSGIVAVPVPYPDSPFGVGGQVARLKGIIKDAEPSILLTTSTYAGADGLGGVGGEIDMSCVEVASVCLEAAKKWHDPGVGPETLSLLQYTSGSTNYPKGVMLTHGNMTANLMGLKSSMRRHEWDSAAECRFTAVTWLPPFHDMGLAALLFSLLLGGHCIVMAPLAFLMRPMLWLEAVSTYGAQFTGAPNFAYELCVDRISPQERTALDLSKLKVMVSGAEPVRARTLSRFIKAFSASGFQSSSFMPCYGMAEANVYVSGTREKYGYRTLRINADDLEKEGRVSPPVEGVPECVLVSNGRPPAEVNVRIVDPDTCVPCPEGWVGEIWISGASVGIGYWRDAERTKATFRARVAEAANFDWLRSGDLGFLQDGELYVTGRIDDMVILDGRNIHPQDIELTVADSHDVLRRDMVAVFGLPDKDESRVVAVAEITWRGEEDGRALKKAVVHAIRSKVAEEHHVGLFDVVLLRRGGLPRTTSGKVQRHQARNLYMTSELRTW